MRKMKDSGIEWIGEIPEDWEVRKLKTLTSISEKKRIYNKNEIYIGLENIDSWTGKYIETTEKVEIESNITLFDSNSVLFGKLRPYLAKVLKPHQSGQCSTEILVFTPLNIHRDFLFWNFLNTGFIDEVNSSTFGAKMPRANLEFIGNCKLPFPSLDNQVRIANFLNEKCALIDRLVERHQEVIEKLKAYRQSVISETVTRGLDPDAPMKDSGIPWIGKIPEGWKTIKLKYLIKYIESGVSVNAGHNAAKENEYGVLKTSCVSKFNFDINENKSVDFSEMGRTRCPVLKNTIIVSRMNTPELVGACGYVEKNYPNIFLPDRLWQVHFKNNTNIKYIWYYLICKNIRNYYASLSTGTSSSMQNISQEQFEQVIIVLPDTTTQNKITSYLDSKCQFIDSTITKKQSLIAKLTEYKKSIIYEYVTGKKEVPAS